MTNSAAPADTRTTIFAQAESAYRSEDYETVRTLLLPLAESDDSQAQAWIGMLHLNGFGVEADEREALDWFVRAADNGDVLGAANAGTLLIMGKGVDADPVRGVEFLERAAASNDTHALFNLGTIHSDSEYLEEDLEKAADYYRRAAELGHYPSQSRLGYMYAQGRGVGKDRVQAYLWLTLAAQHGIGTALEALEGVVRAMSSDEKEQGMRLFDQWRGRTAHLAGPSTVVPVPG